MVVMKRCVIGGDETVAVFFCVFFCVFAVVYELVRGCVRVVVCMSSFAGVFVCVFLVHFYVRSARVLFSCACSTFDVHVRVCTRMSSGCVHVCACPCVCACEPHVSPRVHPPSVGFTSAPSFAGANFAGLREVTCMCSGLGSGLGSVQFRLPLSLLLPSWSNSDSTNGRRRHHRCCCYRKCASSGLEAGRLHRQTPHKKNACLPGFSATFQLLGKPGQMRMC